MAGAKAIMVVVIKIAEFDGLDLEST